MVDDTGSTLWSQPTPTQYATPEKNGDTCGHRVQEVLSLQGLTKHMILRFNV